MMSQIKAVCSSVNDRACASGRLFPEMQGSQAQLRMMINQLPAMVWSCGPDGSMEFLNQRSLEYTGRRLEQSLGWGWKAQIHTDDLERLVGTWRRLLETGEPGQEEARIRRHDGQYRWFLFRAVPVHDQAGRIIRWYGTNTDIEDRRCAEDESVRLQQELESERDRLRLLLEAHQALVANLDLQTLFERLAARLKRVMDCNFVGLTLFDPVKGELQQHLVDYDEGECALTRGMVIPMHGSATGKAFRTRKLVCLDGLNNTELLTEIYGTPEGQSFYQLILKVGIPTGYFLPLIYKDKVIAVLQLTKYAGASLKSQHAEFLTALASQLSIAVANALEHSAVVASRDHLSQEQRYLREEIDRSSMFEGIVGTSVELRRVLAQVNKVAPSDSTVLILGETGTGKELITRAIHKRSRRAARAFIRVNCAAIPQQLIASELFGHERGAFTGAQQRRLGRFELADGGTIFLDEVGELPMETQIALLRVLQEKEFERVGGTQPISVDVRVLAATNRNLKAAVASGAFREDLFYRLNVFPILIPSLRERPEDIPLLLEHFIDRYATKAGKRIRKIEKKTLEFLQGYHWPGNIRELQNVVERAVILCDSEIFSVDETWLTLDEPQESRLRTPVGGLLRLDEKREKELIETALAQSKGRVSGTSGAAKKLGIPRQTLESKIISLGINKNVFKSQ